MTQLALIYSKFLATVILFNPGNFLQCRIVVSDGSCHQSFSLSLKDTSEWSRYVCHMQMYTARLVSYRFSSSCWCYAIFALKPTCMNPTGFCFSIERITSTHVKEKDVKDVYVWHRSVHKTQVCIYCTSLLTHLSFIGYVRRQDGCQRPPDNPESANTAG